MDEDKNERAIRIVKEYIDAHLDKSDDVPLYNIYVVWQCYILGNAKWLISTTLRDGMYYEVTYNREKREYYLDAYKKFENKCIAQ